MSLDLSLDIETLGVNANAPVLSVGWCLFDYDNPNVVPYDFRYYCVDIDDQTSKLGRVIDPSTFKWWIKQSEEAREALFSRTGRPFKDIIPQLQSVLDRVDTIWAKGPDFDCVILKDLIAEQGVNYGWPYWKHRCVRTMVGTFPSLCSDVQMQGTAHNALADAVHQANQIRAIAQVLQHGE